jgi:hypothetical protein
MTYSITRKGIGLSAAIAGLLAFAPVASAIEVDLTGHVDRMVRAADNDGNSNADGSNGAGSDIQHLDNGADQSRLQLLGIQEMDSGEAGVDIEMRIDDTSECYDIKDGFGSGGLGGVGSSTCGNGVEWSRADAWYEGGWGRVSLGKGDSATRGSDRADLSGTDLNMNYDNRRNAGLSFQTEATPSAAVGKYGQAFLMYEGQRSQNRARYDTPVFAGVQIKVSTANSEKYAVGATWATKEDSNFQVRVAAGYTALDTASNPGGQYVGIDTLTSISASALLGMGLNFTVGYGSADSLAVGAQDQSNIHGKVGYLFGENIAVAIRYMTGSDVAGVSSYDADSIGISAQWTANDWLDVYGGIETASVEQAGVSSADLMIGTVGLKVSF